MPPLHRHVKNTMYLEEGSRHASSAISDCINCEEGTSSATTTTTTSDHASNDGTFYATTAEMANNGNEGLTRDSHVNEDIETTSLLPSSESSRLWSNDKRDDTLAADSVHSRAEASVSSFLSTSSNSTTFSAESASIPASSVRMLHLWLCGLLLPSAIVAWVLTHRIVISTVAMLFVPFVALLQGSRAILRYRLKYGNSPIPKSPSQGVVKVTRQQQQQQHSSVPSNISITSSHGKIDSTLPQGPNSETSFDETPLRLLVIGDSLAAGVGQSHTATPVMPESIAKSLSKTMGGRAVVWTCHGLPGASAGWIVRELEQSLQRGKFEPSHATTHKHKTTSFDEEDENCSHHHHHHPHQFVANGKPAFVHCQSTDTCSNFNTIPAEDPATQAWEQRLRQEGIHFDPTTLGPFDIAVVFTGSNDLKSAFFPFLLTGEDAEFRRQAQNRGGGYGQELTRILHVLDRTMRDHFQTLRNSVDGATHFVKGQVVLQDSNLDLENSHTSGTKGKSPALSGKGNHYTKSDPPMPLFPMVVLPGMPASSLPVFSMAPLKWLTVPIVDIMDSHKRRLARRHNGKVLFIESPTVEELTNFVDGIGEHWEQAQDDNVTLRLQDIRIVQAQKIEQNMYDYFGEPDLEKCSNNNNISRRNHHFDAFSADGIHPNEVGYDFWGRYIAHHIKQEWERRLTLSDDMADV